MAFTVEHGAFRGEYEPTIRVETSVFSGDHSIRVYATKAEDGEPALTLSSKDAKRLAALLLEAL